MLVVEPDAPEIADADGRRLLDDSAAVPDADAAAPRQPDRGRRVWSATWPKVAAVALGLFLWQLVVWSGWKPEYVLPGPGTVFDRARRPDRRRHRRRGDLDHDAAGRDRVRPRPRHRRRRRQRRRRRRRSCGRRSAR